MNIYVYTVFAYALMAVISLMVVGVIVLLNKILNRPGRGERSDD
ncbi:MAG: hypothetical protein ACI4PC_04520 [Oscillospiraceae bacterium]